MWKKSFILTKKYLRVVVESFTCAANSVTRSSCIRVRVRVKVKVEVRVRAGARLWIRVRG